MMANTGINFSRSKALCENLVKKGFLETKGSKFSAVKGKRVDLREWEQLSKIQYERMVADNTLQVALSDEEIEKLLSGFVEVGSMTPCSIVMHVPVKG